MLIGNKGIDWSERQTIWMENCYNGSCEREKLYEVNQRIKVLFR